MLSIEQHERRLFRPIPHRGEELRVEQEVPGDALACPEGLSAVPSTVTGRIWKTPRRRCR